MATLAALAPACGLGFYAIVEAQRAHRAKAEGWLLEVARTVAREFDDGVQARVTTARLIASLTAFDKFPSSSEQDWQRLSQRMLDFAAATLGNQIGVWTVDDRAVVRVASTLQPFERLDLPVTVPEVEDAIRRAAQEERPVVSGTFESRATGNVGFLVAYPVIRDERVIAVVTVTMRRSQVQELLAAQYLPHGAFSSIKHRSGYVIARVPERNIGSRVPEDFRQVTNAAPFGIFRSTSIDGLSVVAAFTELHVATDYVVSVAAPIEVVEENWISVRRYLIGGGAAAFVVAATALLLSGGAWRSARRLVARREAHLGIALDKTGLATWDADLRTRLAVWSPRHFDILGYERDPSGSATTTMWWNAVHPDDRELVREQWQTAELSSDGLLRLTYRVVRQDDGQVRWCETIGRSVGQEHMIGVLMDVTDAKQEDERRSLLAREVDHRSKNLLAVVQAMVAMTQAPDVEGLRRSLTARVLSLAKTHSLLAQNQWRGSTVREILETELQPRGTSIILRGGNVATRAEAVQPLAMAVHELATNAAKYGSLSITGGRVWVEWKVISEQLIIIWAESGGPRVTPPASKGFGSRMIQRVLGQIGGAIEFDWRLDGLHVQIAVPLSRLGS